VFYKIKNVQSLSGDSLNVFLIVLSIKRPLQTFMRRFLLLSIILTLPFLSKSQDHSKQAKSIGVTASLPWINSYVYYDYTIRKSSSKSGFVGLGASGFYKVAKNKFSLNGGFTGDLPAPVAAFDYGHEGTRTNILCTFFEGLYHRNLIAKWNIIAGLNYVKYCFGFTSYVDTLPSYSTFDKTLGITIGSEYRFGRTFSVALFYRPAIVSLDLKQYMHLISLDARFDINVWRQK